MRTPRITAAAELAADIETALAAADLEKVLVTTNALDIPSGVRHGVIVITPPDLTFTTFTQTEVSWQLVVVAGPADNLGAAWARIDAIVAALQTAQLDLDTAEADMFTPKGGQAVPGYAISLTPQTYYEESE